MGEEENIVYPKKYQRKQEHLESQQSPKTNHLISQESSKEKPQLNHKTSMSNQSAQDNYLDDHAFSKGEKLEIETA